MPAANIIQLRQLLREKLPAVRLGWGEAETARQAHWITGIAAIDEAHGGLPKGALAEVIAPQRGAGSALLRNALLRRAAAEKQIVALIDGHDSFDAAGEEPVLSRLLWVRGRSAEEALKAADLLLRDQNVTLVLLDLMMNPAQQIRRIAATTWFRFQRILESSSTICLVFTPQPMVSPAQVRLTLAPSRFTLESLEQAPETLVGELKLDLAAMGDSGMWKTLAT
jgi:hypothetical protein